MKISPSSLNKVPNSGKNGWHSYGLWKGKGVDFIWMKLSTVCTNNIRAKVLFH